MSRTTNARNFEVLAEKFFSRLSDYKDFIITRNAKLSSPDGPREIDVLLEGKLGPVDLKIIIECKDYKGKVDVTKVDGLHSKMMDVSAHKAILISYKGFSRTALRKAARLGIELFTLSEALNEKWSPQKDLPILITEVTPFFNFQFEVYLNKGDSIDTRKVIINDIDVFETFFKFWNTSNFELKTYSSEDLVSCLNLKSPYYIREANSGGKISISRLNVVLEYAETYYFGNISSLPGTLILNKVLTKDNTLLIDAVNILDYRNKLSRFNNKSDIPNKLAIEFNAVSRPELLNGVFSFNISLKDQNRTI